MTKHLGRHRTRDNYMTYDSVRTFDGAGNHMGAPLGNRYTTHDGRTVDSTGAFLVGELERLDYTLHEPLVAVTWGRDIDLREDVTLADEVSSFTLSTYASQGGLGTGNSIGNGKAWIGKNTDQITGVSTDISKVPHPLHLWAIELKYTIPELESSARLGRPIDQQKYNAMQLKHQMDIDEMVYIGDKSMNATGLINNSLVTNVTNLPAGASASTFWSQKTPDEILADINFALTSTWTASAWAVMSDRILIPPTQFGYISTQKVSQAGNISILRYIMENNLLTSSGRGQLTILPSKWNIGAAAGGSIGVSNGHDRMVVYKKDKNMVRYPMTLIQRTPLQFFSIYQAATYFCRLGEIETVYPTTIGFFDLL